MANDHEGMIDVPGGRVWYRVTGAEAPGVPLLAVHGGPGAPHDYQENLALLADERPVIFYDQLGCGHSDRPDDPSLWRVERFVAELDAVRRALGLERVSLLGQSWGAMLVLEYILNDATGVERVVLSAPLVSSPLWMADQRALLAEMPEDIQAAVNDAESTGNFDNPAYQNAMMTYYKRHLCRLDPWPDCLQRTFDGMGLPVYLAMWGPSEFTCTGTLRTADLTPCLPEIHVPVLFTCGRYDEARPATVDRFCELVPDAELVILEDASHMHHLEQPERYLAALRGFLGA